MIYNKVKNMVKKSFLLGCCVLCGNVALAQNSYEPLHDSGSGNAVNTSANRVMPPNNIIEPVIILVPQIIVQKNYKQITLQDLDIKTNIIGNVATTTYEMTLYNPNSSILEAELVFPLSENQTIAAVALDINGKMREGVVVEKTKARQTFEAVVRQGADPLLVEKTAGNQFKTRIYPFAPEGTRKIRIVLEEFLKKEQGQFKYTLPLQFKQTVKSFSLDIEIPAGSNEVPEVTTDLPDFRFTNVSQVARSRFEAQDYLLDNMLSFRIPQAGKSKVFTHTKDNKTYFYGNLDIKQQYKEKTMPDKIAVVWDTSLSGGKRNIEKEKDLLRAYLKKVNNASVLFIPFNMEQGDLKKVSVKGGDAAELFKLIDAVVYDGATRFSALSLKKTDADEILLFSDGINTFDKQTKISLPDIPVYIINSSSQYEPALLKAWANKTYGSFINLTSEDSDKALSLLTRQPLRILQYKANKIKEIYPPVGSEVGENISISGILTEGDADLEIILGYDASHKVNTEKLSVKAGGNNPAVARLWAMQKIQDLEQDSQGNKEQILALGQEYGIVTSGTSLLVLESAADYARYNITPPEELLSEYNRIIKDNSDKKTKEKNDAWKDAVSQASDVKDWWKKTFEVPAKKGNEKYKPLQDIETLRGSNEESFAAMDEMSVGSSPVAHQNVRMSRSFSASAAVNMASDSAVYEEADFDIEASGSISPSAKQEMSAAIKVKSWDPDTPYMRILKASKDAELYADYLKLKTGYQDQPSFYFDITDEFIRRGKTKEALLILSNITEMQLDNVELLRIAANKLMQIEQYGYAVELFEKITQLRDEDPQSFRDLALAYWAKGDYQKAFDLFYYVLGNNWHRSNEVKQVVFVELNNLLFRHPKLKKKDLPKELVFNMPVDIRIVMAWSTDNTDMDLHVVDPLGEECYYGRKLTAIGGRYAHDFREGFGPEEFMLKKAVNGKYEIRTNNFSDRRQSIAGPTTVYLDIYTDYSRPNQKHERVFVRTENVKEKNSIGEVIWDKQKKD